MAAAQGARGGRGSASEFTITLDDVEYPVVFDGGQTGPWKITVNGRPFTVEVGEEGRVLVDGITYDVALEGDTARVGDEPYPMQVTGLSVARAARGRAWPAPVEPAAVKVGADAGSTRSPGGVAAIMPGKITRVMVVEGQEVEKGEAVCVLEAMKMENELRAEREGVVRAVHVKPGDDVTKDQVLVEIEARTVDQGTA